MTFTKEAILERLIATYTGPGSAVEGSFAGDVLRACADTMAELWSTEIDGLERRAFVSSAIGDNLTNVCADRGVERREGESDEDLRQRTLAKLSRLPSSGNADHYTAWCLETEGILRVRVLPLARGAGSVDIVAVGLDGKSPEQLSVANAQSHIDAQRPIGADVQVLGAVETALNITATVKLMDNYALETVQISFKEALDSFFRETALLTSTISYAKVLRLLLDTEGVADVTNFTLDDTNESLTLDQYTVAVTGNIILTEANT